MTVLDSLEVELLLEAIYQRYGYDFRDYARASLVRRLGVILIKYQLSDLGACQHRLLSTPEFFYAVLDDLTITVSDLFRDPEMYSALQAKVLPRLADCTTFKVWHAGCSSGEEVYSLAILLSEAGIYNKAVIYATDINKKAIEYAKSGLFSLKTLTDGEANYSRVQADGQLKRYFTLNAEVGMVVETLKENIVFARHNLVTDQCFGEMQLIMCRNVLIYFNKSLQAKVLRLFTESLAVGGYLVLGSKETLRFSAVEACYQPVDAAMRIYQKVRELNG